MVAAEPPFLNLSVDPDSPRYVEKVVNDASTLVRVEHLPPAEDRLPAANGTLGKQINLDAEGMAALHPGDKTLVVQVIDPGPSRDDPTAPHTATLDFDNSERTRRRPPPRRSAASSRPRSRPPPMPMTPRIRCSPAPRST